MPWERKLQRLRYHGRICTSMAPLSTSADENPSKIEKEMIGFRPRDYLNCVAAIAGSDLSVLSIYNGIPFRLRRPFLSGDELQLRELDVW
ncbi:hypothetical protein HPP92_005873 [Vanilla planifolia]|uniref:Uncharacterized protein n=1 Tax=Vanilla planifolia TaxID=51239 RepID=A0A835VD07_VANPL|nr:hypothetical protein HPP92_005873 [Vanilla planifolia]